MRNLAFRIVLGVGAGLLTAVIAGAHYTWVAPASQSLLTGKAATIRICHGHHFPESEEVLDLRNAELTVISPVGVRTRLTPILAAAAVTATFTPREAGLHRVVFMQDRGVFSRTAGGVKPGGRDQHPDAAQAFRTVRSAIVYLPLGSAPRNAPKPSGAAVELTASIQGGEWKLQLLANGAPAAGVAVEVFTAGSETSNSAGETDASGKLAYRPSASRSGPMLFSAEWKAAPPAGAPYDSIQYSTSLYVGQ